MCEMRLYICGETEKSERLVEALRAFLKEEYHEECDLQVIDVIRNPDLAQEDDILATPTLLQVGPPEKRIFGDLGAPERLRKWLKQ